MEMTWLETTDLLGLDLLAGMILALLALDLIDHALRSAWKSTRAGFSAARRRAPSRHPVRVGTPRHA
jgi:NAD(P)H-hydrate repair Nnr-like enzyme with NAD(P)H-hydrate dehydratase domain